MRTRRGRALLVHSVWACEIADTYHVLFSLPNLAKEHSRGGLVTGRRTRIGAGSASISGATLFTAAQQLLGAITHLYLGATLDCRFVVHSMDVGVRGPLNKRAPVNVQVRLRAGTSDGMETHHRHEAELLFHQEVCVVAAGQSSFRCVAPTLERTLTSRHYQPGI